MNKIVVKLQDSNGVCKLVIGKQKLDNYIAAAPAAKDKSYEDAVRFLLEKYYKMVNGDIDWNGIYADIKTLGMETVSEMVSFLMVRETIPCMHVCGNCGIYISDTGLGFCTHTYGAHSAFSQLSCWRDGKEGADSHE